MKNKLKDLGKAFIDIAEDYDTWNTDFSFSLFRKKLKGIGEKLVEYFKEIDAYIEERIEYVLADIARTKLDLTKTLNTGLQESKSNLENSNASFNIRLKKIEDANIKIIKSINTLSTDVTILNKNNKKIVEALNAILADMLDIDEIHGGSAIQ